MQKKVFLKLYTEFNLGDDLFLKIILERYPDTLFYLVAPEGYVDCFDRYNNLNVIKHKPNSLYSEIKKRLFKKFSSKRYQLFMQKKFIQSYGNYFNECHAFVSIGGSIFIQPNDSPYYYDIEYYKVVNLFFKNKSIFYIGCNFGPFDDVRYLEGYKNIFSKATDVCFRERFSYNLFKEIPSVRFSADVVFSLGEFVYNKVDKSVGFSIISPRNGVDSEMYLNKYLKLINYYLDNNYKVSLFSFCKSEGDEFWVNKIYSNIQNEHKLSVNRVMYNGNIDLFLEKYFEVERMYCNRFHSMILSMLGGQKILPIAYSEKMKNVLEDISFRGNSISMEGIISLNVEMLVQYIDDNEYDVTGLVLKSQEQFSGLDDYLINNNKL